MLYSALVLGLLGSLHCLGMCGPIAFMLPVDRSSSSKSAIQTMIYHSGRILAYGIMGALFGLLGKGFNFFGTQQILSIVIGLVMILLVLLPLGKIGNRLIKGPIFKWVGKLKSALGNEFNKKTADSFLTIGFLNGFLPCGLVYMALLGATAMAGPWQGFLYMAIFGMGTIPLMTAAVFLSKLVKTSAQNKIRKLIPVFVVIVGVLFILRGMGLGIPYISPAPMDPMTSTTMECHH